MRLRYDDTLLVDMDGPISDFEQRVEDHMREHHPEWMIPKLERAPGWVAEEYRDKFGPEAHKAVYDLCGAPGFFESLPPVYRAAETLNDLLGRGLNVRVCTSPALWNPTCASAKFEWLDRHIGEGWSHRCIITKDKTLARGRFLIDDKPFVQGSLAPEWKQILWKTSYNSPFHDDGGIWSWDEFMERYVDV